MAVKETLPDSKKQITLSKYYASLGYPLNGGSTKSTQFHPHKQTKAKGEWEGKETDYSFPKLILGMEEELLINNKKKGVSPFLQVEGYQQYAS